MDNSLLDDIVTKLRSLPDHPTITRAQDLPHAEAATLKSTPDAVFVFGHRVTAKTVSNFCRSQQSLHTEIGILLQTTSPNRPEGTGQPALAEVILQNLLGFRPQPQYSPLTLTSAAFLPERRETSSNRGKALYLMLFEIHRLLNATQH